MAETKAEFKLNLNKSSEIEFEISTQGLEDNQALDVRFVLLNVIEGADCSVACTKLEKFKTKWKAKIPSLGLTSEKTCKFKVEVIVEGYFFEVASGTADFVQAPTVEFQKTATVTEGVVPILTNNSPEPEDEHEEPTVTGKLDSGGGLENQEPIRTTKTLTPIQDEYTDESRLGLEDKKASTSEAVEPHDAKEVAKDIVRKTVGNIRKPTTKGTLFKRAGNGSVVVDGLVPDVEAEAERLKKSERVRQILKKTT